MNAAADQAWAARRGPDWARNGNEVAAQIARPGPLSEALSGESAERAATATVELSIDFASAALAPDPSIPIRGYISDALVHQLAPTVPPNIGWYGLYLIARQLE